MNQVEELAKLAKLTEPPSRRCRWGWHKWGRWLDVFLVYRFPGIGEFWWAQQRRCVLCSQTDQRWVGEAGNVCDPAFLSKHNMYMSLRKKDTV